MPITRSPESIGITCALLAGLAFTLNDSGIKFLSGDYALHQIIFIRSIAALVITLAVIIPLEGGVAAIKTNRLGYNLIRGFAVVVTNMFFFMGLATLPLAEATAIFFVSPILITIFSVVFLGETVGLQRWLAVVAGLCGALVIMRPGTEAFQWAALFPLLAAVGYAALHMMSRALGRTEKASTMAFYTLIVFLTFCAIMGLIAGDGSFSGNLHPSIAFVTRAWVTPPTNDILLMLAVGISAGTAGYLITQAYRICEAALIAPFEYSALVLAVIWGILIFDEWPDEYTIIGILMILGSGLFVIWRETVVNRRNAGGRIMPRNR